MSWMASEKGAESCVEPMLVATDQNTGALLVEIVAAKGACPYAIEVLVRFIVWLGHPVVKLRSDGVHPVRALVAEFAIRLRQKEIR